MYICLLVIYIVSMYVHLFIYIVSIYALFISIKYYCWQLLYGFDQITTHFKSRQDSSDSFWNLLKCTIDYYIVECTFVIMWMNTYSVLFFKMDKNGGWLSLTLWGENLGTIYNFSSSYFLVGLDPLRHVLNL